MNKPFKDTYYIPASTMVTEIKVKGSKFISGLFPVRSKDEAESVYNEVKKKYYNATHNCFAYRIDSNNFRYSDDGEPNGTAGKPILQMIDNKDLSETLCVVTRYFGGAKLGTGGLIRAYSDAAKEVLNKVKIIRKIKSKKINLTFSYELEKSVRKLLNIYQAKIDNCNYTDHINMIVLIPESKVMSFKEDMIEISKDTVKMEIS